MPQYGKSEVLSSWSDFIVLIYRFSSSEVGNSKLFDGDISSIFPVFSVPISIRYNEDLLSRRIRALQCSASVTTSGE